MQFQNALEKQTRELLKQLLEKYSPTFREKEAIGALKDYVESNLEYDRVYVDETGNLIAEYGSGDVSIAFIGHIDTVPGELEVRDDGVYIYGRGAVDAKGPLTAAFIGASRARDLGDKVKVYAIALVGEEGPSHGAWGLVRSGLKFNSIVICEPTNTNGVVIEYRGSASVEVKCFSRGIHTSTPWAVYSACDKIVDFYIRVKSIYGESSTSKPIASVTRVECGESSNITPTRGYARVSFRIPYGYKLEDLISDLKGMLPENCSLEVKSYTKPVRVSINSRIVRATVRSIIKCGLKPELSRKYGTSDMNILHETVADESVAYGPGESRLAHTSMERISIRELVAGARVYEYIVREYTSIIEKLSNTSQSLPSSRS